MNPDVVHRCLSKRDCVNLTGDNEPAATTRQDTLCHGCITQIQQYLERLPHLLSALRLSLGRSMGSSLGGGRVSGSKEPPAPFNVNVDAVLVEAVEVVERAGGWQIRVADLVNQSYMPFTIWRNGHRRESYPLSGVERALDIRRIHRAVDKMVGLSPVWSRKPGNCPGCSLQTLGSMSGTDLVTCTNSACGLSFTFDEYERDWAPKAGRNR